MEHPDSLYRMIKKFYLPKYISNTDTSEGETPEIRDACPMVRGAYLISFCLHSIERPATLSKSYPSGIVKFSNL